MTTLLEKLQRDTAHRVAIMQAWVLGSRIEARYVGFNAALDADAKWSEIKYPNWDWVNYDYRVIIDETE